MTFWKIKKTKFLRKNIARKNATVKITVAFFYKSGKLIQDCKKINLQ